MWDDLNWPTVWMICWLLSTWQLIGLQYSAGSFLANRLTQELEMYDKKFHIEVILNWALIVNEEKSFLEII
jgi:hypothetical protein